MKGKLRYLSFIILALLVCTACLNDDLDENDFNIELAPAISTNLPDTLVFGKSFNIEVEYQPKTTCHMFAGFNYYDGNQQQQLAVITSYSSNEQDCQTEDLKIATFEFTPRRTDFYNFEIYSGESEEGKAVFLEKKVFVKLE
ncbi:hypothetical protein [Mesonia sp. HuA40]|uniref:hypothetical protein n=1 Tax=Mesonia sp. HuA40 TaxID=2602761 RepID=UPI0011C8D4FE|nr:hypothetical protein [Mesonia sp. HuA40]TXK72679.1 hypothetical protein FT993_07565 [Mesonia sp. HuA40]